MASRVRLPLSAASAKAREEAYFQDGGRGIGLLPTSEAVRKMKTIWDKLSGNIKVLESNENPVTGQLLTNADILYAQELLKKQIWDLIALYKEIEFNRGGAEGIYNNELLHIAPEHRYHFQAKPEEDLKKMYIDIRTKMLVLISRLGIKGIE